MHGVIIKKAIYVNKKGACCEDLFRRHVQLDTLGEKEQA